MHVEAPQRTRDYTGGTASQERKYTSQTFKSPFIILSRPGMLLSHTAPGRYNKAVTTDMIVLETVI